MERWSGEARRNRDARVAMAARLDIPMATVPWLRHPPTSVDELAELIAASPELHSLIVD